MQLPTTFALSAASSIAWFYLISNSLRGFTYIPQIVVAWRSRDGARSLSLLTWGAWLVAHVAAVMYGLVLRDAFFTGISLINCTGCALVTAIAVRRRQQWKLESRASSSSHLSAMTPEAEEATNRLRSQAADEYLARWGHSPRWLAGGAVSAQSRASPPMTCAVDKPTSPCGTRSGDGSTRNEPQIERPDADVGLVGFLGLRRESKGRS